MRGIEEYIIYAYLCTAGCETPWESPWYRRKRYVALDNNGNKEYPYVEYKESIQKKGDGDKESVKRRLINNNRMGEST